MCRCITAAASDSSKKTLIECELEKLTLRANGDSISTSGATMILSLVPDGSTVRRDDILCRLDSSDYEEVARQQRIAVQLAATDRFKAELDLKAAEMTLHEFTAGTSRQADEDYNGQLALAESDLRRQQDRVAWSESMVKQGFFSPAQLESERFNLMKAGIKLRNIRSEFENFRRFGSPITKQSLEAKVEGARSALDYQQVRLDRSEERLERFEKNVRNCTIRAPHDGVVIYANEPDDDPRIEVGSQVTEKQDLFYLPDLSQMEIETTLHESVIGRVRQGLQAHIKVETYPNYPLEGHVDSVAPLPEVPNRRSPTLMNFLAKIKLHSIPKGLLPGMSAEVEIVTGQRDRVLVVPVQAVSSERDQSVCYVASDSGLERRQVRTGQMSRDFMEIVDGLEEGEQVVLEPSRLDPDAIAGADNTPLADQPTDE